MKLKKRERKIPQGFWNGGACGGESQQRVARMGFHVEESQMLTLLTRPISLLPLQHPSLSLSLSVCVCVCVCVLVLLQRKRNEKTKGKGNAKEGINRRFHLSGSFLKFKVETFARSIKGRQEACVPCLSSIYLYCYSSGFRYLDSSFFQFKNTPTPLYLSRDKTKRHSGKNTTLTPTKILPKKQNYFPVIFQITLSTYKLYSLKKKILINWILKIKTYDFFFT